MAGIYIHIPFCKKACHYCNFHFSTQTKYISDFTCALLQEIELQQSYLSEPIDTLYFGGGTPSLLPIDDFNKVIDQIGRYFTITPDFEFTIEVNPDDVTYTNIKAWKKIGINRLSLGIQSFQPNALSWMNRAHTTEQSHAAIQMAQDAGFENISADLIYGTPHLTDNDLRADLAILSQYQIPHLSCYALTVEEKTALSKMIELKKMSNVDSTHQATQFEIVVDYLSAIGMEHYEISNFAKPGFRSKHNSNYWKGIPYLGLGPSAHSFNATSRQWNVSNNHLYFQSLANKMVPYEVEKLDLKTQYNEYVMISLRCIEGMNTSIINEKFGSAFSAHTNNIANQFITKGYIEKTSHGFALTKIARFFADGIASDFFVLD